MVVDNGSVYTENLIKILKEYSFLFEKGSPDKLSLENLSKFDAFILSGRKKNEKKINQVNSKLVSYSITNNKKLLGICYGAEILSLTLGGTIRKLSESQKGIEKIFIQKKNDLVNENLTVFESHGFEISKLPDSLVPLANSKNCRYEIIQYKEKPIFGTQFHPEMTKDGKDLIIKFCSL